MKCSIWIENKELASDGKALYMWDKQQKMGDTNLNHARSIILIPLLLLFD